MTSCYLAKTQFRVKGHHVYKYAYKTGIITNDFIENDNKYSILYCGVFIYCFMHCEVQWTLFQFQYN